MFLTYRATPDAADVVRRTVTSTALFDFVAPDDVRHEVWKVPAVDQDALAKAFGSVPALYIADGHHRAASAARARRQLRAARGAGEWDRFLAVAFPDDQVQILAYNRIIKDLAGASPAGFLSRLREKFPVVPGPAVPVQPGHVSMYLDGMWYTIELGEGGSGIRDAGSGIRNPEKRLDVDRLQEGVLAPMLNIGDVRTDKRIDFVGGARGAAFLEQSVRSGRAAVAFSLFPVSIDDLMSIADEGGIMPPKSTWFEPKLRDGLLSHVL